VSHDLVHEQCDTRSFFSHAESAATLLSSAYAARGASMLGDRVAEPASNRWTKTIDDDLPLACAYVCTGVNRFLEFVEQVEGADTCGTSERKSMRMLVFLTLLLKTL